MTALAVGRGRLLAPVTPRAILVFEQRCELQCNAIVYIPFPDSCDGVSELGFASKFYPLVTALDEYDRPRGHAVAVLKPDTNVFQGAAGCLVVGLQLDCTEWCRLLQIIVQGLNKPI